MAKWTLIRMLRVNGGQCPECGWVGVDEEEEDEIALNQHRTTV